MSSEHPPSVVDLADASSDDALLVQWWRLARDLDSSYFQTPAWVRSWWETIAGRPATRLACWEDGGELRALVALSHGWERLHRRVPVAIPVEFNAGSGVGAGDHCGFLVAPEVRSDVATWLSKRRTLRPLLVRNVRGAEALPSSARAVASTRCPAFELGAPRDPIGRSPNFRRQIVRFSRRLERSGVEFAWLPSGRVDVPTVATLFDLHERRRAAGEQHTSFTEKHRALLVRLCAFARPGCGPAAVVARRGRDTVGVLLGFEWNGCFSAYQSGWDPSLASESLGTVLVYEAMRRAAAAGAGRFDFLRGSEAYKYRFGAHDDLDASYLVPRGSLGRVLDARYRSRDLVRGAERGSVRTRS